MKAQMAQIEKGADMAKSNENVLTSKEVAIVENAATGVMVGGVAYQVKGLVTVPTLKQETGETVAIRIDTRIEEKPNYEEKEVTINGVKQIITEEKIISVVRVTELSTGQPFSYVLNAITVANLRGAYPDDGYVGKSFAIQKLGVVAGKRYKDVKIVEIEAA